MDFSILLTAFENFGSAVGVCLTILTFWGLISKKPIAAFKNLIRKESKIANEEIEQQIQDSIEKLEQQIQDSAEKLKQYDEAITVLLRHSIVRIYQKYKATKKIPNHIREDILYLAEQYTQFEDTSYINMIVDDMRDWEVE